MLLDIHAICPGKTLLQSDNYWRTEIACMADSNECVRFAVLALSARYVLDYSSAELMKKRAAFNSKMANVHVDQALCKLHVNSSTCEDVVVSALIVLTCEDVRCDSTINKKNSR